MDADKIMKLREQNRERVRRYRARNGQPRQVSIYLGNGQEPDRRLAALDKLAETLGVNRSELVQQIADGDLLVTRRPIP